MINIDDMMDELLSPDRCLKVLIQPKESRVAATKPTGTLMKGLLTMI